MKVYRIKHHHEAGRTYPWASGYNPIIKMPWWETVHNDHVVARMGFWSVNPGKPGMDIDPGGRVWSEVIGCGLGWPRQFFSEKVIADLEEAGVRILRKTEMPIATNKAKTLQKQVPPKYYVLEAERGIEKDAEAMGIPLDEDGKPNWDNYWRKEIKPRVVPLDENGKRDYANSTPAEYEPFIFRSDSWNGSPLFADHGLATCVLYCTEALKKLAEEKGWRNIEFEEIGYMK